MIDQANKMPNTQGSKNMERSRRQELGNKIGVEEERHRQIVKQWNRDLGTLNQKNRVNEVIERALR